MTRSAPGPIDRLVEEYGRQGRWTELGGVLDGMDRHRLSDPDHVAWYHVRGIVEYRLNQRARAREIFEEAVWQFPNSGWLNYGLGQEYEFEGRIDEMAACFEHVRLADVGGAGVLAMARYCYLWDRWELAQRAIRPIFDAYHELKIVDDTFLYLRGLPGFGEAFGYLATLSWLGGQLEVARTELARARAELQEYTFERLGLDLEATASGDWGPDLTDLDAVLPSIDARFPTGRLRMKRAVLRSRRAPGLDAALAELDDVPLASNDHAWLGDVRRLARAEACHRLGMASGEAAELSIFWPRQALLFEPNHAFDFGLIAYQERLKLDYRSRHRR